MKLWNFASALVSLPILRYRRTRLDWAESDMIGQALGSIKFADGEKIFNCCLDFLVLILVLPAVLQPALLCVQFADSGGNIGSRYSDPDKFTLLLYFQNFSSVFWEILKGKGLFHVRGKHKHFFERVTFPLFVSALKGIKFLFAICNRAPCTKLGKIRKIKGYCTR